MSISVYLTLNFNCHPSTKYTPKCPNIDFLLPPDSYQQAKALLDSDGSNAVSEHHVDLHYALTIEYIEVEFHGMANTESGGRLERILE